MFVKPFSRFNSSKTLFICFQLTSMFLLRYSFLQDMKECLVIEYYLENITVVDSYTFDIDLFRRLTWRFLMMLFHNLVALQGPSFTISSFVPIFKLYLKKHNKKYGPRISDNIGQKPVDNFNIYQKLNRKCQTCQPRDWS